MNRAPGWVGAELRTGVTLVSQNPASYDNVLVEKSLEAYAIFKGCYYETQLSLQMWSMQMQVQHCMIVPYWLLHPSIWPSHSWYLSHGSSLPHSPILVASIPEASWTFAENSPHGAVLYCQSYSSPWRVYHPCSAFQARDVLCHCPQLHHPPHRHNMPQCANCPC